MWSQLDYYSFMGYPPEALRHRYGLYAERFAGATRVLDVACGRGEFLELLQQAGIGGIGVDVDPDMVREVRRKGLAAEQADATEYLQAHTGEFDGIFAAHVIEHLPAETLVDFVKTAACALRQGGRLILVTPNPNNLQMQLHDFWIDLQHERLYSPEIVHWLMHLAGLQELVVGLNFFYRTGPVLAHRSIDALPGSAPPAHRFGRERLSRLMAPSLWKRLGMLEDRVNDLTAWMQCLYPPGEYFATGVR